ncbi:hypothetical protein [Pseudarthrobacter cellobiosi]|uniref:hypothetical protein n=1 Tax=Pseudarthrobacter cellobiosi TaxID=2953654 RepID=UPI00208FA3BA|nr:hypothetical protein [Pseudarthrobacter sp. HLT1-5]MCO4253876.1 hypothetical protein [Pseudarthrobacter sp. HLT1-5]
MTKTIKAPGTYRGGAYGIAAANARLPLDSRQAEDLMDRAGNVTVTILLNQENYLRHVIASATDGSSTPELYAHRAAFSFGRPFACAAEITGASGPDFMVSYTTHIREFLDD